MGSYGSYNSPSPPPRKTTKEKCSESLENFLSKKKVSYLLEAYEHIKDSGDSLIHHLLSLKGKEIAKEFPDYEIEYKANVIPSSSSKLFSKEKETEKKDLVKIHKGISFDHNIVPYLKDTQSPQVSTGYNHFYSVKGIERFVLSQKNDKWNTKTKENSGRYNLGLEGEEFVMKRKELISMTNPKDLLNMVLDIAKSQEMVYEGFMEKTKADQFLLNTTTGRVYNFTLSLCKAEGRKDLVQMEIEYAGYVPLPVFKRENSEKDIVKEILEISKYMIDNYNGVKIEDMVLNIESTALTKFEWITGRASSVADKVEDKPLADGQTFFGDSFK